jgi:hypothetical protein
MNKEIIRKVDRLENLAEERRQKRMGEIADIIVPIYERMKAEYAREVQTQSPTIIEEIKEMMGEIDSGKVDLKNMDDKGLLFYVYANRLLL